MVRTGAPPPGHRSPPWASPATVNNAYRWTTTATPTHIPQKGKVEVNRTTLNNSAKLLIARCGREILGGKSLRTLTATTYASRKERSSTLNSPTYRRRKSTEITPYRNHGTNPAWSVNSRRNTLTLRSPTYALPSHTLARRPVNYGRTPRLRPPRRFSRPHTRATVTR